MKITTALLRKIINEELAQAIDDSNRRAKKADFPVFYNIVKNAFKKGAGNLDDTAFYLDSAAGDISRKFSPENSTTLDGFVEETFEKILQSFQKERGNIPRQYNKIMRNLDKLKAAFKEKLEQDTTEF